MSAGPQQASAPRIDPLTIGLGYLLIGMAGFVTWDQWAIWSTKDDYTFGYLVPAFSAYVLWDRWQQLSDLLVGRTSVPSAPCPSGLLRLAGIAAIGSLLLFAFGAGGRAIFGVGVMPTLLIAFGFFGAALTFGFLSVRGPAGGEATSRSRWAATGLLLFPAGVWIISGPFLYLVDNQIKGELLSHVTELVSGLLRATGHAVRTNGNTILFANGDGVGVADACSGIRSLSACVFAGAFLGALFLEGGFPGAILRRAFMILLSGFVALFLNIVRNTYLAFHALEHGSKSLERDPWGIEHGRTGFSALGTVHDLAGNIAMLLALALLVACLPLINRFGRPSAPPRSQA